MIILKRYSLFGVYDISYISSFSSIYNQSIKKRIIIPQSYTLEFKKQIISLPLEKDHTYKNAFAKYGILKSVFPSDANSLMKNAKKKARANLNTLNEEKLVNENLPLQRTV